MLAAALLVLSSDLDLRWRGRELAISGQIRSVPEGATVVLRFRRIVMRSDLSSRPLDAFWDRKVALERGGFRHREAAGFSGEFEVEVVLILASGLERPQGKGSVRAPPSAEAAVEFRKRSKDLTLRLEAWRKALEGGKLPAAPEPSGVLTATADLLESFRSDLERLREVRPGQARPLSAFDGEPLSMDTLRDRLDWIGRMAERERTLWLVGQLEDVAREIRSRTDLRPIDRTLGELLGLVLQERSDDLKLLAASVEQLFQVGPEEALNSEIDRLARLLGGCPGGHQGLSRE